MSVLNTSIPAWERADEAVRRLRLAQKKGQIPGLSAAFRYENVVFCFADRQDCGGRAGLVRHICHQVGVQMELVPIATDLCVEATQDLSHEELATRLRSLTTCLCEQSPSMCFTEGNYWVQGFYDYEQPATLRIFPNRPYQPLSVLGGRFYGLQTFATEREAQSPHRGSRMSYVCQGRLFPINSRSGFPDLPQPNAQARSLTPVARQIALALIRVGEQLRARPQGGAFPDCFSFDTSGRISFDLEQALDFIRERE